MKQDLRDSKRACPLSGRQLDPARVTGIVFAVLSQSLPAAGRSDFGGHEFPVVNLEDRVFLSNRTQPIPRRIFAEDMR
ncbi:MAG: hypothetical protein D6820_05350 [Lentisphaerae bacterium]|nr:MAG: hypothetical protein D6820_05350 [Lentisphaerota bacterium]